LLLLVVCVHVGPRCVQGVCDVPGPPWTEPTELHRSPWPDDPHVIGTFAIPDGGCAARLTSTDHRHGVLTELVPTHDEETTGRDRHCHRPAASRAPRLRYQDRHALTRFGHRPQDSDRV